MRIGLVLSLLAACGIVERGGRTAAAEPQLTVAELRALKPAEISSRGAVSLSGVVTYLRDTPAALNFILDDGTGGIMVYPNHRPLNLKPGQRVAVQGVTQRDRLLVSITTAKVETGAMESLPAPLPASLADVLGGKVDGRFVEVEDVVRAVRIESPQLKPQRLALDLGPRGGRVNAWVSRWEGVEGQFSPGVRVRMRGVGVRWHNDRSQPVSTSLLINSPADVQVLPAATAPSRRTLDEALRWVGAADGAGPVSVSGTVTYYRPGELLFIEDGGRALRSKPAPSDALNAGQLQPPLKPGDRVEVTGFPAIGDYTTELEDAWARVVGSGEIPAPLEFADAAALLDPRDIADRDARLVSLRATVREVRVRDGRTAVELRSAGRDFAAWLPVQAEVPPSVRTGAEVRATGVCTLILGEEARRFGRAPDGFSLTLGGPGDLVTLRPAPWWTPARLYAATGAVAVVALLAAAWALSLRQRNALLLREIAARRHAEARLAEERRRVSADLHDTLQQTLVAASLQLTAASRSAAAASDGAGSLLLARQLLARGQQEVRDAVWDLHMEAAEPQSLPALLLRACAESDALGVARVHFSTTGVETALPGVVVAHGVRLVREAVTNAIKHARPRSITVACEFTGDGIRLSVADDGEGFDTAAAPGPGAGHFGITGMRERVRRLNGTLELRSVIGTGTTLLFWIPLARP